MPAFLCSGFQFKTTNNTCDVGPQVRAGVDVDNAQLVKFAALFNDELTLDNLSRAQLVSWCCFVSVLAHARIALFSVGSVLDGCGML